MDKESLEAAVDRWEAAGVIDGETANAIRQFERSGDGSLGRSGPRHRLAWIVAVMGAVLVGAGILVFLLARWAEFSTTVRTALLVAVPVGAALSGLLLDRRWYPSAGHALWLLGAILLGPTLFLLADIHAPTTDPTVLLFIWGLVALPMGQAFVSRVGVGMAIAVLLIAASTTLDGTEGPLTGVVLGGVAVAAGALPAARNRDMSPVYWTLGSASGIVGFMVVSASGPGLSRVPFEFAPELWLGFGLMGLVGLTVAFAVRRGIVSGAELALVAAPPVAAAYLVVLIETGGTIHWLAGHFLIQVGFLTYLLVVVVVAIRLEESWLINLGVIGFLLLVLVNLAVLTGEVSGAIALIVAGLVLLLVAVGLERGRRRLLALISG